MQELVNIYVTVIQTAMRLVALLILAVAFAITRENEYTKVATFENTFGRSKCLTSFNHVKYKTKTRETHTAKFTRINTQTKVAANTSTNIHSNKLLSEDQEKVIKIRLRKRNDGQSLAPVTVSTKKYELIQTFTKEIMEQCLTEDALDSECAQAIAKNIGMTHSFALIFASTPYPQAVQFLTALHNACIAINSPNECGQAFVELYSSELTTAAKNSFGFGIFGPILAGMARKHAAEGVQGVEFVLSKVFPEK
jgi:hypothetical protein